MRPGRQTSFRATLVPGARLSFLSRLLQSYCRAPPEQLWGHQGQSQVLVKVSASQ